MQTLGFSASRLRRLSTVLQGYVDRGEISGLVTLIHRYGKEAYVDTIGWQDKEAQTPIKRNDHVDDKTCNCRCCLDAG